MRQPYPIETVEEDWLLDEPEEGMGSKKKFWYTRAEDDSAWLFKYPRPQTGEHWAERVAADLASQLSISHAAVELATFRGQHGSTSRSFVFDNVELIHGNQLLRLTYSGYDVEKRSRQSQHTVQKILMVLDEIFEEEDSKQAQRCIAEYLVLDALIGNTDRHHENWGILMQRRDDGWLGGVAPSFDHASSLGRELRDRRRCMLLEEDRVGNYIEKGAGAVYWSSDDPQRVSPLELVRRAALDHPELFRAVLRRFNDVNVRRAVDRIPDGWISAPARSFAKSAMDYSITELRRISVE